MAARAPGGPIADVEGLSRDCPCPAGGDADPARAAVLRIAATRLSGLRL